MAAGRRSVVWAESARAALDDVVTYIAQDSREAAVRVLVAALDAATSLDQHAERGRIVPELNQPDLRELSCSIIAFSTGCAQMMWSSLLTCTARATSQPGVGSSVAVPATNPCSAASQTIQPLFHLGRLLPQRGTCPSGHAQSRREWARTHSAQSGRPLRVRGVPAACPRAGMRR